MSSFEEKLKKEIIKEYGSVNQWALKNNISTDRFYNFVRGNYNPTLKTLKSWLKTIKSELHIKKK